MQRNEQMYHHCLQHKGRHVKADMVDQQTFYGFVENVDVENVYLIVLESDDGHNGYDEYHGGHGQHHHHGHHHQGHGHHPGNDHYYGHGHQHHGYGHQDGQWGQYQQQMDQRVFGGYGYGYPGYGYGGFGFPGFRWRRLVLPLTALAAISLLY